LQTAKYSTKRKLHRLTRIILFFFFSFFLWLSLINHRYFYRITEPKEKSFLFYKRFDGWLPMSRAYHIIPDIFNNKTLYILR
jgi:hypothetical protein